jgi:hypothetical protein
LLEGGGFLTESPGNGRPLISLRIPHFSSIITWQLAFFTKYVPFFVITSHAKAPSPQSVLSKGLGELCAFARVLFHSGHVEVGDAQVHRLVGIAQDSQFFSIAAFFRFYWRQPDFARMNSMKTG